MNSFSFFFSFLSVRDSKEEEVRLMTSACVSITIDVMAQIVCFAIEAGGLLCISNLLLCHEL